MKGCNQEALTMVSGTSSPRSMISRISSRSRNSEDMVTARDRLRDSRMKGVLTPLPDPGAPFSHTTSLGVCSLCRQMVGLKTG